MCLCWLVGKESSAKSGKGFKFMYGSKTSYRVIPSPMCRVTMWPSVPGTLQVHAYCNYYKQSVLIPSQKYWCKRNFSTAQCLGYSKDLINISSKMVSLLSALPVLIIVHDAVDMSFSHQKFDCRLLGRYIVRTFVAKVHIHRFWRS